MTTLTIPTTADAVELVGDVTGSSATGGDGELVTFVTTEGGVRLRLVAPLGGATSNPDVLRVVDEVERELHYRNLTQGGGRA